MPEIITNLKVMKNFLVKTEELVIQISIHQLRIFCLKIFLILKLDYWFQNCGSTQQVAVETE